MWIRGSRGEGARSGVWGMGCRDLGVRVRGQDLEYSGFQPGVVTT
jgi:hypothetical protein